MHSLSYIKTLKILSFSIKHLHRFDTLTYVYYNFLLTSCDTFTCDFGWIQPGLPDTIFTVLYLTLSRLFKENTTAVKPASNISDFVSYFCLLYQSYLLFSPIIRFLVISALPVTIICPSWYQLFTLMLSLSIIFIQRQNLNNLSLALPLTATSRKELLRFIVVYTMAPCCPNDEP